MQAHDILHFWFTELTDQQHFTKDTALDDSIRERFGATLEAAARCELFAWRTTAQGRLAEILVLDQFSRNVFRDTPRAFAYMPYMHSESLPIHEQAVQLFDQPGLENNHDFELKHKAIIERFGRYPHRNDILGRPCTAAELVFLEEPGSSF